MIASKGSATSINFLRDLIVFPTSFAGRQHVDAGGETVDTRGVGKTADSFDEAKSRRRREPNGSGG